MVRALLKCGCKQGDKMRICKIFAMCKKYKEIKEYLLNEKNTEAERIVNHHSGRKMLAPEDYRFSKIRYGVIASVLNIFELNSEHDKT